MTTPKGPFVGVGMFLIYQGKVLMGQRMAQHGQDTWAPPGGHLNCGETPEMCGLREACEECGLQGKNPRIIGFTNDIFPESGRHYVTVHVEAQADSPHFQNIEELKNYKWLSWDEVTKLDNLFLPVSNLLKQHQKPSYL